jgi:cbb3-type cytochrome oxidase maturation protein
MEILFLLIGISFFVAATFLGLFLWSVKTEQYKDSYTPSIRILFDEIIEKKD